jgi:hypothetical protein
MFAADNSLTTLRQYVEAMEREENIIAGRKSAVDSYLAIAIRGGKSQFESNSAKEKA